ncbi:MAG: DnaA regulatory inactivator Hda [Ideonella sp. MAG2]|nr:MAG: DnaA regulatory inactivator Hda [Ideonella sp. MAG2]
MKQLPLDMGLGAEPSFDTFVPGHNAMALAALRQWSVPSAPLYLHGPEGAGKTHLLAALAAQVRAQGGRCGWFQAQDPLPWVFDEGWTLIVIEGAEQLDEAHQHAAFTLFVEAATHGIQMACSGRLPPVDLPVRDDLRSRFAWGPVFALQALDEAATRSALRQEADRRGVWLSDEVMEHLMTRFSRDLASQMALLKRLDHFSLAEKRVVTVPLLKKMLAEEGSC